MAGAVFQSTKCAVAGARHKDDVTTSMVAGCAAGATLGFHARSAKAAVTGCGVLAAMAGMVKFAGGIRPEEQAGLAYVEAARKARQ